MIKLIPVCFLLLICSMAVGQNTFKVNGIINDYSGELQLEYDNVFKSTKVIDGKFSFTGELMWPTEAVIRIPTKMKRSFSKFVIEPGELIVEVKTIPSVIAGHSYLELTANVLKGGPVNNSILEFRHKANTSMMIGSSISVRNMIMVSEIAKFASKKPNDVAALCYVVKYLSIFNDQRLEDIYANLSESMKHHKYGMAIKAKLNEKHLPHIGERFPDFDVWTLGGSSFDTRNLRGRFALIEFWSKSYIPDSTLEDAFRATYSKFLPKGFEILGLSSDDSSFKWSGGFDKSRVDFPTYYLHSSLTYHLKVFQQNTVPNNYLLDPDGKIIAKGLTAKELELKLAQLIK